MKLGVVYILTTCWVLMSGGAQLVCAEKKEDGQGDSWEKIPEIIESISEDNFDTTLPLLEEITLVELRKELHNLDTEENKLYLKESKEAWQHWWENTGKKSLAVKGNKQADEEALDLVWTFFDTELKRPNKAEPVWIPETWTFTVTFTNGDYFAKEKEIWMVDRKDKEAHFTKLRGEYSQAEWTVSLSKYSEFTVKDADKLLRAIIYLNENALPEGSKVADNAMPTYYAGAKIALRDSKGGLIMKQTGYNFTKTQSEYKSNFAGRSYYFLNSMYGNVKHWNSVKTPSSELLAPYREFLTNNKPYFCWGDSEIVSLFAQYGGKPELESLYNWAEKQKKMIQPDMDWRLYYGELKSNVINLTRYKFESTVEQIKSMENRLKLNQDAITKSIELEKEITKMLALVEKEKEADIMRHPQPLRDLVRIDRLPNDSDLEQLKQAIEEIRRNPDPKLFHQLAAELDDGTLEMHRLLEYVILDSEHHLEIKPWGVKPWGVKQEAIAVYACIEALPAAMAIGEAEDLVVIILKASGGGTIEFKNRDSASRIEVDSSGVTYSGAENPLTIKDAQKKLKKHYTESKKK